MIIKDILIKNEQGKEFEMELYINVSSMKNIERELKQISPKLNFYKAIPLIQQGELTIAIIFVGSCLHKRGEQRAVGSDWFDDNHVDFLKYANEMIVKLTECLADLNPSVKSVGK